MQKKSKKPSSSFKDAVYKVVAKIPKGSVMTYAGVAKKAGFPKAARAVGTLMAKNFDPKIPCHRVIRTDGTIGNYNRGGAKKKREILIKEGAILK